MANAYVKDPRKVAKPGDVVRVKVLEVDPKRRRISLTMRLDEAPALIAQLGASAKARIASLCDGGARGADLLNVCQKAIAARERNRQNA